MKRDMDLARQIMLELEKTPYSGDLLSIDIDGRDENEVSYHVMLLAEAGLVEAKDLSDYDVVEWAATRLTWQGHEFLDAAKNETIWQKTKKLVQEKGGALTFDVAKAVLAQVALKQVGL